MKYIFQFMVVIMFCLLGEIMGDIIPLPIAGSIWGLCLLLLALALKIVPLSWVSDVADFFHSFMALFFIVPAVAVINILDQISDIWIYLGLILVITYLIAMLTTGITADALINSAQRRRDKKDRGHGC